MILFWSRAVRLLKKILTHLISVSLLAMTTSCSSVFYYPSHELFTVPEKLGYQSREISFKAADGQVLYGWYFPAENSKGTIVQFHGNAENMSSHYLSLVWLVAQGYSLFTFDYRGYGKAQGEPEPRGTNLDGIAALDTAWKLHSEKLGPNQNKPFVVYGQSLGGLIAARALQDFTHEKAVVLLVQDSTFSSYKTIARRKLAFFWFTWPFSPLGSLVVSDEFASEDVLKASKRRILVIHDELDPAVPFSCGEDIYNMSMGPKEFWKLNQGLHTGVFADPKSVYRAKFVSLLGTL